MALATQNIVLAKQRALHFNVRPAVQGLIKWLFMYFGQMGANPDLQVVEFAALSSSEVVIADVPCRLYAVVLQKATATATYTKITDSATTSSDADSEYRIKQSAAGVETALIFPYGEAFANGITMQGNTAPSTGTGSGANGGNGYCLVGAA